VETLKEIETWAKSPNSAPGYWMCGMAGTGKSTIAKSICNILHSEKLLAGTFFCSRQIPECRDYRKIVPTLAYQLAQFSQSFESLLGGIMRKDPDIATKDPSIQVEKLLVEPWRMLKHNGYPGAYAPVLVLDALDECDSISSVLNPLVQAIKDQRMPGLKFFFTSRPEVAI
jgi:hypothetical protein